MDTLIDGQMELRLMAVGAQEVRGLVQPGAGVAIAVPVVTWGASSVTANEFNRGLQGEQKVRKGRAQCGFATIGIQPVAGFAVVTVAASLVLGIETPAEMTASKINLAFDQPARILEQRYDISGDRPRAGARQSGHHLSFAVRTSRWGRVYRVPASRGS